MRREGSTDLGLLMMLEDADGMSRAGDHIVCADDDWLVISRTGRRGQRRNESSRQHLVDQPWVRSTGGRRRVLILLLFLLQKRVSVVECQLVDDGGWWV